MPEQEIKIMRKIQLLICVLILSASALAGDYAHFHFIGFSRDAKYLAFEEYGFNDDVDDDSAYSKIYIVNVRENRWVIEPFISNGNFPSYDENKPTDSDKLETEVRDKNHRKAAKSLKRFKIIDGNTGLQVAAHLINEYDTDYNEATEPPKSLPTPDAEKVTVNINPNTSLPKEIKHNPLAGYQVFLPQQVSFTKRGNALYREGFYQLKIKPVPIKQKNCDEYERDMFSFELSLTNESKETRILQHSGKVPKNRGCVDGYGIQEVFIYHNYLAVFIGVFTYGWEGENLRLIAVTGKLDN